MRHFRLTFGTVLLILFTTYLCLFLSYRPYEIDNAWFLSFSYGFRHGIPTDEFMSVRFPAGQDGTILFGKIAAAIQGIPGEMFGWQQFPILVLHAMLLVCSLACWAFVLRRSGISQRVTLLFTAALGISEPIVSAVQRFRYEAEGFWFFSAGLALIAADLPFLGIFLSCVAVETQPIALLGVIAALFFSWSTRKSLARFFGQAFSALLAAAALYLVLHPDVFRIAQAVRALRVSGHQVWTPGILRYFWSARHIPEALAFLFTAICLAIRFQKSRSFAIPQPLVWMVMSSAAMLFVGYFIKHTNPAYVVYVYPLLVCVLMHLFRGQRWQTGVAAIFCVYFAVQYIVLVDLNWGAGYRKQDILQVSEDLRRAADMLHTPVNDLVLTGDYSLFYSHPANFHANTSGNAKYFNESDLVLCFDGPLHGVSQPGLLTCGAYLGSRPSLQLLFTDMVRGNQLHFYAQHPPLSPEPGGIN